MRGQRTTERRDTNLFWTHSEISRKTDIDERKREKERKTIVPNGRTHPLLMGGRVGELSQNWIIMSSARDDRSGNRSSQSLGHDLRCKLKSLKKNIEKEEMF